MPQLVKLQNSNSNQNKQYKYRTEELALVLQTPNSDNPTASEAVDVTVAVDETTDYSESNVVDQTVDFDWKEDQIVESEGRVDSDRN